MVLSLPSTPESSPHSENGKTAYLAGAAIASLVLVIVFPSHLKVTIASLSLEKWHSNSLLAQLNSRAKQSDADPVTRFAMEVIELKLPPPEKQWDQLLRK